MRICIDARKINDLGIGTYLRGFLEQFKALESAHTFWLLTAPDEQFELRQLFPELRFITVPESAKKYSLKELFSITARLREVRADLYHSPHYPVPLFKICPTVTIIHDLIHLKFPEYLPSFPARFYARAMMQQTVRISDQIVTISEWSKNDLLTYFSIPESRISVVYGAVADCFTRLEADFVTRFKAEKLGIQGNYLLYCGAFKPHKNLGTLLTAFHKIKSDLCPYLVLAGDQLQRYPGLLQIIARFNLKARILNMGWLAIDDLVKLYNGAAAFVFPSEYEGFGLPPLEAMRCGVPVIASNAACLPEVLGDAACYFEPRSSAQLATQIQRLLTDPQLRQTMRARGLEQVKKYSWENSARQILKIYQQFET